jgi:hypothetical protein
VRIDQPDHVFADTDEFANRCQPFDDVARERRTNFRAFEIREGESEGRARFVQHVLRLVALGTCLVEQGLGDAVLRGQFFGPLELPVAVLEVRAQPRNVGLRALDLDVDQLRIDARNECTRIDGVADVCGSGRLRSHWQCASR